MHKYVGAGAANRSAIASVCDKAYGLPRRGRNVGGGVHVSSPQTWDGNGTVPPGWTSFKASLDDGAVFFPDEPETSTKLARLTAGEQAQLAAARAQAEPHDPEENSEAAVK